MQKFFCSKCNYANLYEDIKPVFCGKCGKPTASNVVANFKPSINLELEDDNPQEVPPPRRIKQDTNNIKSRIAAHRQKENYDDNNYDDEIAPESNLDFNNIQLEIETENLPSNKANKTTLGDLAQSRAPKEKIIRQKGKNVSKKKFSEEWENDFKKGTRQNSSEIGLG